MASFPSSLSTCGRWLLCKDCCLILNGETRAELSKHPLPSIHTSEEFVAKTLKQNE